MGTRHHSNKRFAVRVFTALLVTLLAGEVRAQALDVTRPGDRPLTLPELPTPEEAPPLEAKPEPQKAQAAKPEAAPKPEPRPEPVAATPKETPAAEVNAVEQEKTAEKAKRKLPLTISSAGYKPA